MSISETASLAAPIRPWADAALGGPTTKTEEARRENLLLAKARRHIVEHIADPGLDPNRVASALCISRRSLYALFQAHCLTPSRLIHEIRLEQAKRAIGDPALRPRKMTSIAFDVGFTDYATFGRQFKAHYGLSPSAFRTRQKPLPGQ